jgi:GMP synthase-like glutamine amidotransferase
LVIALVQTEPRSELTAARGANYWRLRVRLASASGDAVEPLDYEVVDAERLARADAVVLSGSSAPWSAHDPAALDRLGDAVRAAGRPVLGICGGMQLLARFAGGEVAPAGAAEHGFLPIAVHDDGDLLRGLASEAVVFQDHTDEVTVVPDGFRVLASSDACAVQALAAPERRWWGTQFHPEEWTTEHPDAKRVLAAFFELAHG